MKVLFVCKHNRFRSKVAEALFKKHTKKHKVQSRGVKHDLPYVAPLVVRILRERGVEVDNTPRFVDDDSGVLDWADKIIVVADNVSFEQFPKDKIEVWRVRDCDQSDKNCIELRTAEIDKKVRELIKRLG